jgi:hypothetical protein
MVLHEKCVTVKVTESHAVLECGVLAELRFCYLGGSISWRRSPNERSKRCRLLEAYWNCMRNRPHSSSETVVELESIKAHPINLHLRYTGSLNAFHQGHMPNHVVVLEIVQQVFSLERAGKSVVFCWVLGCTCLPGNEAASVATKEATVLWNLKH